MFKNDLIKGNSYEKKFGQWLADEHGFTKLIYHDGPEFDLKAVKESPDGVRTMTYEIKTDFYQYKTDNLAIEFFCLRRHKLTGIYETKANWFVYIFPQDKTYIFHPLVLKKYLEENTVPVVIGGDNNMALLYLLTREQAKSIAREVISGII